MMDPDRPMMEKGTRYGGGCALQGVGLVSLVTVLLISFLSTSAAGLEPVRRGVRKELWK